MTETKFIPIHVDKKEVGGLQYYQDQETGKFVIENIVVDSDFQRKGLGTGALQDFVNAIGPDQEVWGVISHDETRAPIRRKYFSAAQEKGPQEITGRELESLPLVAFLRSGNIDVEKITVTFQPEVKYRSRDERFTVQFFGRTHD